MIVRQMTSALIALFAALVLATHPVVAQQDASQDQLVPLHSFSLHPPYIEESLNNRWWNFGGDVVMEVNKYIRIAPDRQSKQGWLWCKIPFTSQSWVVEFEFKVAGSGTSLFGDGFAFWFTTEREKTGPVFGSKDEFTGLGVFFDTYSNGKHRHGFPYVNAMVGDGKTKYDVSTDGKSNEIGGCTADFRGKSYSTLAKVRYIKGQVLEVLLNVKGTNTWETCFRNTNNISLPSLGYLGFSSHTGDATDNHDIIRVVTNGITNAKVNNNPSGGAPFKSGETPNYVYQNGKTTAPQKTSFLGWLGNALFVLVVLAALVGVGFGVVLVMNKMKEKSYKRF